jgi:hypothetical protein
MEAQPLAQAQLPELPVILDAVALDHLRLRPEVLVHVVERVEDERGMVPRHEGGGEDRIEDRKIRLRHELENLRRRRGAD